MHPRSLLAGLSGVALLAPVLALGPGAGADEPVPLPTSALALRGAEKVVVEAYGRRVYTDLGLRLVAGAEPFELRARRASYDEPIAVSWVHDGQEVPLPDGSMTDFRGLDDVATLTVTRVRDGRVVRERGIDACFNSWGTTRSHPDAPGRSPYPTGCPWNPYTVGSVMGVQAGWSSSLLPDEEQSFRIDPGRYDVTAALDPTLAALFGIPADDAAVTTRLVVEQVKPSDTVPRREVAAGRSPRPAPEPDAPAAGELPPAYAPDLRSLPAFDVQLNNRGTAMRFAATVWNAGSGPLVVDGFRGADSDHMDAYQYFLTPDGVETGHQQVGEFHFHGANHQHWHFEDFAQYRLLAADQTLAVASTKASFCLANTDAVDLTLPGADWQPENTDLSSACGGPEALGLRQVLAAGSGDTYLQYRAGQAFRIKDLPDGVYYIAVEANPDDERDGRNLVEADYTNNDALRQVTLGTDRKTGERWVTAAPVGIVDETLPRFLR